MKLRSVELVTSRVAEAARFMTDIWGLVLAEQRGNDFYLRGSGAFPYLMALHHGDADYVRSITFVCTAQELSFIRTQVGARGLPMTDTTATDPGGGYGVIVELPEGELFRFLVDAQEVPPLPPGPYHRKAARTAGNKTDIDLPVQLTHVVFNSCDAEATGTLVEQVLNFKVSDRTAGMVFVRCNRSHHSIAFARAGFASLNHIAFEMEDIEAVMRSIGRMRDHQLAPSWGPGRHGPGDNVFAYFISPFGPVVEFSTAVEIVPDDYVTGTPDQWTWPEKRIDQWGISDKDLAALGPAERSFCFRREWQ